MTEETKTEVNSAPANPTEISMTYRGPDLKTLAIGGGMLVGVAHAAQHVAHNIGGSLPSMLGNLTPQVSTALPAAVGTAAVTL